MQLQMQIEDILQKNKINQQHILVASSDSYTSATDYTIYRIISRMQTVSLFETNS
ncbi:hypothetical protein C2845_PM09G13370 [Panicum miliaceum]|uniref:Uncharacterized protein n=1 Tax=Panicum miliaceum TaxID=4540 RepID=A0A3L6S2T4_PANMI|nr:hypothetical protein C2845_PM09G13370 [Panicum miliaceum]